MYVPRTIQLCIRIVFGCWTSTFLVTHGCYKGAKLLLRSSIENFIKAVCFDEYPDIVIKKSVYEVFDIAKASMTFSGSKKYIRYYSYRIH